MAVSRVGIREQEQASLIGDQIYIYLITIQSILMESRPSSLKMTGSLWSGLNRLSKCMTFVTTRPLLQLSSICPVIIPIPNSLSLLMNSNWQWLLLCLSLLGKSIVIYQYIILSHLICSSRCVTLLTPLLICIGILRVINGIQAPLIIMLMFSTILVCLVKEPSCVLSRVTNCILLTVKPNYLMNTTLLPISHLMLFLFSKMKTINVNNMQE